MLTLTGVSTAKIPPTLLPAFAWQTLPQRYSDNLLVDGGIKLGQGIQVSHYSKKII